MSVYVDRAMIPYRGMLMNHMLADTPEELFEMSQRLGLRDEWCHGDHFDICARKRGIAVSMGAIELSTREIVQKRREIRENGVGNAWNLVR